MSRKSRYLTRTDRDIIERMYNRGESKRSIARFLEVAPSTITREIPRGLYDFLEYRTWKESKRYSAEIAQTHADYQNTAKGRPMKIGNDFALVQHIEDEILKGYSPDVVISNLAKQNKKPFSTVTLYRYIDCGYIFTRITNSNLLEKSCRKRGYKKVKKAKRPPAGKSIEHRPEDIDTREEFGHWEMDCVIGKLKGKRQALLVLTERKTRFEIISHLRTKSSRPVVRFLDSVQSKCDFPNIFKSITVDNGSEFADCYGMEHDKQGNKRTDVYYCHPYTSCERGSNERMNRMVRRFFPKGQSLYSVTQAQCRAAADWLNNYPRKLLNYVTPAELFAAELAALSNS
jgi:IS30 family transposase